jgi:hypothetical protein
VSSGYPGISLVFSDPSSVNASVSTLFLPRSLVASDRSSVLAPVPVFLQFPLFHCGFLFSAPSFLSDASRTSFPLVIAPSCATSSSSLALSSPPDSVLAVSVIEESLVSDVPLSPPLEVPSRVSLSSSALSHLVLINNGADRGEISSRECCDLSRWFRLNDVFSVRGHLSSHTVMSLTSYSFVERFFFFWFSIRCCLRCRFMVCRVTLFIGLSCGVIARLVTCLRLHSFRASASRLVLSVLSACAFVSTSERGGHVCRRVDR